ncbi:hypothetical protein X777_12917 [Ooceraea biroi]|uniref:Uncharacterized protein n=1 Tax=Ooceraea biroi TaxID=2015173 RepID=A0A026VYX5_OOCBI|nr:hypothetical protein X777_12917 [Ooceraea biroi]
MVFQLSGLHSSWNGYRVIDFLPKRTTLRVSSHVAVAAFSKNDARILYKIKYRSWEKFVRSPSRPLRGGT